MRNVITIQRVNPNPFRIFEDLENWPTTHFEMSNKLTGWVDKDSHYLISIDMPGIPK